MKTHRAYGGIILCALFLLAGSCHNSPVSLKVVAKEYKSKHYERLFEVWSRDGQAYNLDTLENSLKVSATYLSWEMRQVYVARYAYDYGLDEKAKTEMLKKERAAFDRSNEFIVAATATYKKWAQFRRSDSPWKITLLTSEGVEVLPDEIKSIHRPSPMLSAYFKYITIYREVFRFYFPLDEKETHTPVLTPELSSFSLIFKGALGRVELKWRVESAKESEEGGRENKAKAAATSGTSR